MDADRINVITGRAPLRASSAVRSALAQRGKGVGSISYFYSPKNERDFVVSSDLEFYHFLHLEGSDEVQSYDLDPDRVSVYLVGRGYVETLVDMPWATPRYTKRRLSRFRKSSYVNFLWPILRL